MSCRRLARRIIRLAHRVNFKSAVPGQSARQNFHFDSHELTGLLIQESPADSFVSFPPHGFPSTPQWEHHPCVLTNTRRQTGHCQNEFVTSSRPGALGVIPMWSMFSLMPLFRTMLPVAAFFC